MPQFSISAYLSERWPLKRDPIRPPTKNAEVEKGAFHASSHTRSHCNRQDRGQQKIKSIKWHLKSNQTHPSWADTSDTMVEVYMSVLKTHPSKHGSVSLLSPGGCAQFSFTLYREQLSGPIQPPLRVELIEPLQWCSGVSATKTEITPMYPNGIELKLSRTIIRVWKKPKPPRKDVKYSKSFICVSAMPESRCANKNRKGAPVDAHKDEMRKIAAQASI